MFCVYLLGIFHGPFVARTGQLNNARTFDKAGLTVCEPAVISPVIALEGAATRAANSFLVGDSDGSSAFACYLEPNHNFTILFLPQSGTLHLAPGTRLLKL